MGSPPLPLCACCGKPMSGSHLTLRWLELAGEPMVGWHLECADSDRACEQLRRTFQDSLLPSLQRELARQYLCKVNNRGEGRVLASRAWWVAMEAA